MLFYFSEEDEKPVSVQGKKAGVDTLKIVILNGCNYRFNEHRRIYILKEARKRRMEPTADRTPQAKKQKDVFVVSKTKWYLTVRRSWPQLRTSSLTARMATGNTEYCTTS